MSLISLPHCRLQHKLHGSRDVIVTVLSLYYVTWESKRLHNEGPYDFFSPSIFWMIKSRRMKWVGKVARIGDRRGAYRVLVMRPERKRPLGRLRRGWEDNIKVDLQNT